MSFGLPEDAIERDVSLAREWERRLRAVEGERDKARENEQRANQKLGEERRMADALAEALRTTIRQGRKAPASLADYDARRDPGWFETVRVPAGHHVEIVPG